MMKNEKNVIVFGLVVFATVALICLFYGHISREFIKEKMNIKRDSIVEVYDALTEEGAFVNVIQKYIMDEQLFFVYRSGLAWSVEPVLESDLGITNVEDLVFHQWNGEVFVEIAYCTNKGNGDVALYRMKDGGLTPLVTDKGGVDKNMDTTTNAVYENGRLFLTLQENEANVSFPNVIFQGTEWVYGYDSLGDYTGDELLYQRKLIRHVYCWDENKKEYVLTEDTSQIMQQIEGVYPVTF